MIKSKLSEKLASNSRTLSAEVTQYPSAWRRFWRSASSDLSCEMERIRAAEATYIPPSFSFHANVPSAQPGSIALRFTGLPRNGFRRTLLRCCKIKCTLVLGGIAHADGAVVDPMVHVRSCGQSPLDYAAAGSDGRTARCSTAMRRSSAASRCGSWRATSAPPARSPWTTRTPIPANSAESQRT